jgi:hypothetical protein
MAGPLEVWSCTVALTGPSFSLWIGWSEAVESFDPLATLSKMPEGAVSSLGWTGMAGGDQAVKQDGIVWWWMGRSEQI